MIRKRLGYALLIVTLISAFLVEAHRTRTNDGIRRACGPGDWATLTAQSDGFRIRILPVEEKLRVEKMLAEDQTNVEDYRKTNSEDEGRLSLLRLSLDIAGGEFYQVINVTDQSVTLRRNDVDTNVPVSQIIGLSVFDTDSRTPGRYVEIYSRDDFRPNGWWSAWFIPDFGW